MTDKIEQKRKEFMDAIVNCDTSFSDDQLEAICKVYNALYSQEPGMVKLDKDQTPTFARVDIKGKPEVGRFYDGYLAGQKDMYKANFKRIER
jgi:hypothetical protein